MSGQCTAGPESVTENVPERPSRPQRDNVHWPLMVSHYGTY